MLLDRSDIVFEKNKKAKRRKEEKVKRFYLTDKGSSSLSQDTVSILVAGIVLL